MKIIAANEGLAEAARILSSGGIVAVPTETVYGLAALATDGDAVARVYAAKGRPSFNPLIVHVDGIEMADKLAEVSAKARQLMEMYWPGPLTLVLPARPGALAPDVLAGLATVAVRHPQGPLADLAREVGPLAAPSANRSGRLSPTTAAHVADELDGRIDLVLDGGVSEVGIESTIVAVEADRIRLLRPGAAKVDGTVEPTEKKVEAPGMMESHYAPEAELRLNVTDPDPDELTLVFGQVAGTINLSPTGDLEEAARNLYAALRALDGENQIINVSPIPEDGIGRAINDRLRRAAAPRAE